MPNINSWGNIISCGSTRLFENISVLRLRGIIQHRNMTLQGKRYHYQTQSGVTRNPVKNPKEQTCGGARSAEYGRAKRISEILEHLVRCWIRFRRASGLSS